MLKAIWANITMFFWWITGQLKVRQELDGLKQFAERLQDELGIVNINYNEEKDRTRMAEFELKAKISTKVHRWVAVQLQTGDYDQEEIRLIMQDMNQLRGMIKAQEDFKMSQKAIEQIHNATNIMNQHKGGLYKTAK